MRALVFVLGALTLWGIAYLSIWNCTSFASPGSLAVIFPAFMLVDCFESDFIALLISAAGIPLIYALWSFPLFSGQNIIPRRSKTLAAVLILLSIVYFTIAWSDGVQWQGALHTAIVCFFNLLFLVLLIVLARLNDLKPSYVSNFIFHLVLFAWLGWVAFPYLGELP